MADTIELTFNCGDAGEVVWRAPRSMFNPELSDKELQKLGAKGSNRQVNVFFRLIYVLIRTGGDTMNIGMNEIVSNLTAVGKRAIVRGKNFPRG
jgi:hypothetical protein